MSDSSTAAAEELAAPPEEGTGAGIQLVSDGTAAGTKLLLDGRMVQGVTEATWRFNARERRATLVIEMRNVTIDVTSPIDPTVAEALRALA